MELPLKSILQYGKDKFKALLAQCGLKVIVMAMTDGPVAPGAGLVFGGPFPGFTAPAEPGDTDKANIVATHLKVFKEQVEAAQEFNPYLINSHSCKDYFTTSMAKEYFTTAVAWCKAKGYKVHHETHRKRALYSPWVSRDLVPTVEGLTLVADLSHWVNVAETDCNDPDLTQVYTIFRKTKKHDSPIAPNLKVIEDMAPRVHHVHLRVGYDHGPQVPDPRLGQWLAYTEGHERWWDAIWRAAEQRGDDEVCCTTEFGPPNYQVQIANKT